MTVNITFQTDFENNQELQNLIINNALAKAKADIYALLAETEEEAMQYQIVANSMWDSLEEFQAKFPQEYEFVYPNNRKEEIDD